MSTKQNNKIVEDHKLDVRRTADLRDDGRDPTKSGRRASIVNPEECGCFYYKHKNKKKQVLPLPLPTPPSPSPSPPVQLQQPRRFTKKLYNPNPNIIPLLRLNQLIRTREEVTRQDRIFYQQNIPTNTSAVQASQQPIQERVGTKGQTLFFVPNQISNNIPENDVGVCRNIQETINIIKDQKRMIHKDDGKEFGVIIKDNLPYFNSRDFDEVFLNHIQILMSFKRRTCNEENIKYNFSVQDDQNSIMTQGEPMPLVFIESSSEYRPAVRAATIPSENEGVSYYSV